MILDHTRSVKHGASINHAVLGPRRVGKTSIIKNVMMEFEDDKEIIPIFIDCLSIPYLRSLSNIIVEDGEFLTSIDNVHKLSDLRKELN